MIQNQDETGEFHFEVDAGLLFELGEHLVTRASVALAELIKNAYDADATQVNVLLENVGKTSDVNQSVIIIEDNGIGMTYDDVRENWMRIATPDKRRNPISPKYGRNRTGAKGIGRFAARRLANSLSPDREQCSTPQGRLRRADAGNAAQRSRSSRGTLAHDLPKHDRDARLVAGASGKHSSRGCARLGPVRPSGGFFLWANERE